MSSRSRQKAGPYPVAEAPGPEAEARPSVAPSAVVGEAATLLGGTLDQTLRAIAATAQRALEADRATCYVTAQGRCSGVYTTEPDAKRRRFLEGVLGVEVAGLPIGQLLLRNPDPLLVIEDIGGATTIGPGLRANLGAGALMGVRLEHESLAHEGRPEFLGAVFMSFHEPRPVGSAGAPPRAGWPTWRHWPSPTPALATWGWRTWRRRSNRRTPTS